MSLPSPLGVFSLLLTDTSALPSGCGVDRQKADRLSRLSRAWRYIALKLRNFRIVRRRFVSFLVLTLCTLFRLRSFTLLSLSTFPWV